MSRHPEAAPIQPGSGEFGGTPVEFYAVLFSSLSQLEQSVLKRALTEAKLSPDQIFAATLFEIPVTKDGITELSIGEGRLEAADSTVMKSGKLMGGKGKGFVIDSSGEPEKYWIVPTNKTDFAADIEKPKTTYTFIETRSNLIISVKMGEVFMAAAKIVTDGVDSIQNIPLVAVAKAPDSSLLSRMNILKKSSDSVIVWVYPGYVVNSVKSKKL